VTQKSPKKEKRGGGCYATENNTVEKERIIIE
jgi:hypothetical protein